MDSPFSHLEEIDLHLSEMSMIGGNDKKKGSGSSGKKGSGSGKKGGQGKGGQSKGGQGKGGQGKVAGKKSSGSGGKGGHGRGGHGKGGHGKKKKDSPPASAPALAPASAGAGTSNSTRLLTLPESAPDREMKVPIKGLGTALPGRSVLDGTIHRPSHKFKTKSQKSQMSVNKRTMARKHTAKQRALVTDRIPLDLLESQREIVGYEPSFRDLTPTEEVTKDITDLKDTYETVSKQISAWARCLPDNNKYRNLAASLLKIRDEEFSKESWFRNLMREYHHLSQRKMDDLNTLIVYLEQHKDYYHPEQAKDRSLVVLHTWKERIIESRTGILDLLVTYYHPKQLFLMRNHHWDLNMFPIKFIGHIMDPYYCEQMIFRLALYHPYLFLHEDQEQRQRLASFMQNPSCNARLEDLLTSLGGVQQPSSKVGILLYLVRFHLIKMFESNQTIEVLDRYLEEWGNLATMTVTEVIERLMTQWVNYGDSVDYDHKVKEKGKIVEVIEWGISVWNVFTHSGITSVHPEGGESGSVNYDQLLGDLIHGLMVQHIGEGILTESIGAHVPATFLDLSQIWSKLNAPWKDTKGLQTATSGGLLSEWFGTGDLSSIWGMRHSFYPGEVSGEEPSSSTALIVRDHPESKTSETGLVIQDGIPTVVNTQKLFSYLKKKIREEEKLEELLHTSRHHRLIVEYARKEAKKTRNESKAFKQELQNRIQQFAPYSQFLEVILEGLTMGQSWESLLDSEVPVLHLEDNPTQLLLRDHVETGGDVPLEESKSDVIPKRGFNDLYHQFAPRRKKKFMEFRYFKDFYGYVVAKYLLSDSKHEKDELWKKLQQLNWRKYVNREVVITDDQLGPYLQTIAKKIQQLHNDYLFWRDGRVHADGEPLFSSQMEEYVNRWGSRRAELRRILDGGERSVRERLESWYISIKDSKKDPTISSLPELLVKDTINYTNKLHHAITSGVTGDSDDFTKKFHQWGQNLKQEAEEFQQDELQTLDNYRFALKIGQALLRIQEGEDPDTVWDLEWNERFVGLWRDYRKRKDDSYRGAHLLTEAYTGKKKKRRGKAGQKQNYETILTVFEYVGDKLNIGPDRSVEEGKVAEDGVIKFTPFKGTMKLTEKVYREGILILLYLNWRDLMKRYKEFMPTLMGRLNSLMGTEEELKLGLIQIYSDFRIFFQDLNDYLQFVANYPRDLWVVREGEDRQDTAQKMQTMIQELITQVNTVSQIPEDSGTEDGGGSDVEDGGGSDVEDGGGSDTEDGGGSDTEDGEDSGADWASTFITRFEYFYEHVFSAVFKKKVKSYVNNPVVRYHLWDKLNQQLLEAYATVPEITKSTDEVTDEVTQGSHMREWVWWVGLNMDPMYSSFQKVTWQLQKPMAFPSEDFSRSIGIQAWEFNYLDLKKIYDGFFNDKEDKRQTKLIRRRFAELMDFHLENLKKHQEAYHKYLWSVYLQLEKVYGDFGGVGKFTLSDRNLDLILGHLWEHLKIDQVRGLRVEDQIRYLFQDVSEHWKWKLEEEFQQHFSDLAKRGMSIMASGRWTLDEDESDDGDEEGDEDRLEDESGAAVVEESKEAGPGATAGAPAVASETKDAHEEGEKDDPDLFEAIVPFGLGSPKDLDQIVTRTMTEGLQSLNVSEREALREVLDTGLDSLQRALRMDQIHILLQAHHERQKHFHHLEEGNVNLKLNRSKKTLSTEIKNRRKQKEEWDKILELVRQKETIPDWFDKFFEFIENINGFNYMTMKSSLRNKRSLAKDIPEFIDDFWLLQGELNKRQELLCKYDKPLRFNMFPGKDKPINNLRDQYLQRQAFLSEEVVTTGIWANQTPHLDFIREGIIISKNEYDKLLETGEFVYLRKHHPDLKIRTKTDWIRKVPSEQLHKTILESIDYLVQLWGWLHDPKESVPKPGENILNWMPFWDSSIHSERQIQAHYPYLDVVSVRHIFKYYMDHLVHVMGIVDPLKEAFYWNSLIFDLSTETRKWLIAHESGMDPELKEQCLQMNKCVNQLRTLISSFWKRRQPMNELTRKILGEWKGYYDRLKEQLPKSLHSKADELVILRERISTYEQRMQLFNTIHRLHLEIKKHETKLNQVDLVLQYRLTPPLNKSIPGLWRLRRVASFYQTLEQFYLSLDEMFEDRILYVSRDYSASDKTYLQKKIRNLQGSGRWVEGRVKNHSKDLVSKSHQPRWIYNQWAVHPEYKNRVMVLVKIEDSIPKNWILKVVKEVAKTQIKMLLKLKGEDEISVDDLPQLWIDYTGAWRESNKEKIRTLKSAEGYAWYPMRYSHDTGEMVVPKTQLRYRVTTSESSFHQYVVSDPKDKSLLTEDDITDIRTNLSRRLLSYPIQSKKEALEGSMGGSVEESKGDEYPKGSIDTFQNQKLSLEMLMKYPYLCVGEIADPHGIHFTEKKYPAIHRILAGERSSLSWRIEKLWTKYCDLLLSGTPLDEIPAMAAKHALKWKDRIQKGKKSGKRGMQNVGNSSSGRIKGSLVPRAQRLRGQEKKVLIQHSVFGFGDKDQNLVYVGHLTALEELMKLLSILRVSIDGPSLWDLAKAEICSPANQKAFKGDDLNQLIRNLGLLREQAWMVSSRLQDFRIEGVDKSHLSLERKYYISSAYRILVSGLQIKMNEQWIPFFQQMLDQVSFSDRVPKELLRVAINSISLSVMDQVMGRKLEVPFNSQKKSVIRDNWLYLAQNLDSLEHTDKGGDKHLIIPSDPEVLALEDWQLLFDFKAGSVEGVTQNHRYRLMVALINRAMRVLDVLIYRPNSYLHEQELQALVSSFKTWFDHPNLLEVDTWNDLLDKMFTWWEKGRKQGYLRPTSDGSFRPSLLPALNIAHQIQTDILRRIPTEHMAVEETKDGGDEVGEPDEAGEPDGEVEKSVLEQWKERWDEIKKPPAWRRTRTYGEITEENIIVSKMSDEEYQSLKGSLLEYEEANHDIIHIQDKIYRSPAGYARYQVYDDKGKTLDRYMQMQEVWLEPYERVKNLRNHIKNRITKIKKRSTSAFVPSPQPAIPPSAPVELPVPPVRKAEKQRYAKGPPTDDSIGFTRSRTSPAPPAPSAPQDGGDMNLELHRREYLRQKKKYLRLKRWMKRWTKIN